MAKQIMIRVKYNPCPILLSSHDCWVLICLSLLLNAAALLLVVAGYAAQEVEDDGTKLLVLRNLVVVGDSPCYILSIGEIVGLEEAGINIVMYHIDGDGRRMLMLRVVTFQDELMV